MMAIQGSLGNEMAETDNFQVLFSLGKWSKVGNVP